MAKQRKKVRATGQGKGRGKANAQRGGKDTSKARTPAGDHGGSNVPPPKAASVTEYERWQASGGRGSFYGHCMRRKVLESLPE